MTTMHFLLDCLRLVLTLLPFFLSLSACDSADHRAERPNIVLILADDLGYSDIGPYGGEIQTPNLDALAAGGLRFTRFYNAARCCPTRASLLTGLYPHRAGMGGMVSSVESDPEPGPYQGYLNNRCATIAEVLRAAGYRTYMSGKWHVGEQPEHWPRKRGMERYFGLISGASSYFEIIKEQPRIRQMALDDERWEPQADGFYMTDAITDYAERYVREHAEGHSETPFFLYVAYTAPHWPLHALPDDIAKYDGRYDVGWDALRTERYRRMLEMGLIDERYVLSPRPPTVPPWEEANVQEDWTGRMEVYAAMVDRMDQGIGKILDSLNETGVRQNTLVLFLSDNGGCAESVEGRRLHDPEATIGGRGSYVAYKEPWANLSNTPFRLYKQWAHEGGIATPLIAYWPQGIEAPGRITDQMGHVIDIMPTALELAGITYPGSVEGRPLIPLDGRSLVPIFSGAERAGHDALFWEHFDNKAMRQGKWKLTYDARRSKQWELFDLEIDPTELDDVSGRHPERVAAMKTQWRAWADRIGVYPHP